MKTLKIFITILTINVTLTSVGVAENKDSELRKKMIISQIENPFSEKESLNLMKKLEEIKKDEELSFLNKNLEKAKLQNNNKLTTKLQKAIGTLKLQQRQETTKGLEK